jgi:hypothetical protein
MLLDLELMQCRDLVDQPREEQLVLNTIRCLAADLCQQVSLLPLTPIHDD